MSLMKRDGLSMAMVPLALAVLASTTAMAQEDKKAALEEELRYISALIDSAYADFAQDAIELAKKRFPTAGGQLEAPALRVKLRTGRYDEVEKIIAARPDKGSFDTWTLKMELALAYYAGKRYKEADALYSAFFNAIKKPTDSQKKVYGDAAYIYIDMLKTMGREEETLKYYPLAIENAANDGAMKAMRANYLNALLAQAEATTDTAKREANIKTAEGLIKEMLWSQDLYFGDAINGKAHICILKNDVKGAQALIDDYLEMLNSIHEQLREQDPSLLRVSPLPKCRYLLGSLLYRLAEEQIKKAGGKVTKNDDAGKLVLDYLLGERDPRTKKRNNQGALHHCVNVFMNYPESESAEGAIKVVDGVTEILEKHFATKISVKANEETRTKVRRQKFINADMLFDANKFEEALAAYSAIFEEEKGGYTLDMMGPLMKMIKASIYIDSGNKTMAAADRYKDAAKRINEFAEAYAKDEKLAPNAGNALGELADFLAEKKMTNLQKEAENAFFRYYGNHSGALARKLKRAQTIAETATAKEDIEKAVADLEAIVKQVEGDDSQRDLRMSALFTILDAYKKGPCENTTKRTLAAKALVDHFKGIARPGYYAAVAQHETANALVALATETRRADADGSKDAVVRKYYAAAAGVFKALAAELKNPESKYVTAAEERQKGRELADAATYLTAFCIQRTMPATTTDAGKAAAAKIAEATLALYEAYLKDYPNGKYAPASLLQMGTLQTAQGEEGVAAAQKTLDTLRKKFPNSPEAQNAIPMLADALAQMGMKSESVRQYREMFKSGGQYTAGQYLNAAKKLYEAKDAEMTLEACDALLASKNLPQSLKYDGSELAIKALLMKGDKASIAAARKRADELLATFGKSKLALGAHCLIIDLTAAEMLHATTLEERNAIIANAKKSETFIKNNNVARDEAGKVAYNADGSKQIADPELTAKTQLALAQLAQKTFEAEAEGTETRLTAAGSAMNAFDGAMMVEGFVGNEQDPRVSSYIQQAYLGYLELAKYRMDNEKEADMRDSFAKDIRTIGQTYLDTFPEGTYTQRVRAIMATAN